MRFLDCWLGHFEELHHLLRNYLPNFASEVKLDVLGQGIKRILNNFFAVDVFVEVEG